MLLKRKEVESQDGTIWDVGSSMGESTKDILNSESWEIQHPDKLGVNQFSPNLAKYVKVF